jgi:haloalkane dehalogenase
MIKNNIQKAYQVAILKNDHYIENFPYQHLYASIDGHKVHYIDEGTGPVILLLHGNPTFSYLYRHMIKLLKTNYRVVALDYPGFGLSQAVEGFDYLASSQSNVVEQFVDELKLKKFSLFVQDWGGPIGLGLATRRPELIENIFIGNTWAWPVNGDFHFEWFSRLMGGKIIGAFLINQFNAFVNMLVPAGTPKSKISPEDLAIYRLAMPKHRRFVTNIFPHSILKEKEYLKEIENQLSNLCLKKVVFFWGDKDFAFRKKELDRFRTYFKNHETIILEGAGHFIQEESPEEICLKILSEIDPA